MPYLLTTTEERHSLPSRLMGWVSESVLSDMRMLDRVKLHTPTATHKLLTEIHMPTATHKLFMDLETIEKVIYPDDYRYKMFVRRYGAPICISSDFI